VTTYNNPSSHRIEVRHSPDATAELKAIPAAAPAEEPVMNTREVTICVTGDDYKRLVAAFAEERPPTPVFAQLVVDHAEIQADVHAARLDAIQSGRIQMRLLGERMPTRKRVGHPIR
jgi:hypothetical protein